MLEKDGYRPCGRRSDLHAVGADLTGRLPASTVEVDPEMPPGFPSGSNASLEGDYRVGMQPILT